jgi:hypothetical protein
VEAIPILAKSVSTVFVDVKKMQQASSNEIISTIISDT